MHLILHWNHEFRKSRGALLALLVSTVLGEVMLLGGILFLPQDAFHRFSEYR